MFKKDLKDYPICFQKYIDLVPDEDDLLTGFTIQFEVIKKMLASNTEQKSMFTYAPQKWTLKEMLQHMIDIERIFGFRALCFAREETTALPGFDEGKYAANALANDRSWDNLSEELLVVRQSSTLLYKSFTPEILMRTGTANDNLTSVAGMGFITLGHIYHHKKVIEERYL